MDKNRNEKERDVETGMKRTEEIQEGIQMYCDWEE